MSYVLREYICDTCGERFDSLEDRGAERDRIPHHVDDGHCPGTGERTISAVRSMTVWGSAAVRGKSGPPPNSLAMDAAGRVGETVSETEWKTERAKKWADHDRKKRRAKGAPI